MFTADLMSSMLDYGKILDLEIIDSKMLLYLPRTDKITSLDAYQTLFAIFDKIAPSLKLKIKSWNFDTIPRTPHLLKDSFDKELKRANNVAIVISWLIKLILIGAFIGTGLLLAKLGSQTETIPNGSWESIDEGLDVWQ